MGLRSAFFYTYSIFSTPREVIESLIERFFIPTPPNLSKSEKAVFAGTKSKIRMKVFAVVTYWITTHLHSLQMYNDVESDMRYFVECVSKQETDILGLKQVKNFLKAKHKELETEHKRVLEFNEQIDKANVYGPTYAKFRNLPFFSFSVEEIARQMVIIDCENFKQVKPSELLNKNWESENASELAPNIKKITERNKRVHFAQPIALLVDIESYTGGKDGQGNAKAG